MFEKWIVGSLLAALVLSSGCARVATVGIEPLDPPAGIDLQLAPVWAVARATTIGGYGEKGREIDFTLEKGGSAATPTIALSDSRTKVTVSHASFAYLRGRFALQAAMLHPLGGGEKRVYAAEAGRYLEFDGGDIYQRYEKVPFYDCIEAVHRTRGNQALLEELLEDSGGAGGGEAFKALTGQPHCSAYDDENLVFYVTIENMADTAIRLQPVQEGLLMDADYLIRYPALSQMEVGEALDGWYIAGSDFKGNPVAGIYAEEAIGDRYAVRAVMEGSPAEKAGLRKGDVIVSVDGEAIGTLRAAIFAKRAGEGVDLVVKRGWKRETLRMVVEDAGGWLRAGHLKLLTAGEVPRGTVHEGFLVFRAPALTRLPPGSVVKLVLPLIVTEFAADRTPVRGLDLEFDFVLE